MCTTAHKRLLRDFKKIENEKSFGIHAAPFEDDILKWNAVIFGPDGTEWENGIFKLTMQFSDNYPQQAPDVKFETQMFHPNIYKNGKICLDILSNNWSPAYDISSILTSIQSLLTDPNIASPANAEAAKLFKENRPEYLKRVKQCVKESATQQ